ncbi:hypothetical protein NSPZN2_40780 [Nitrospira defluvii]|uniref:Transposase n=1 Tax=Nitrospira defluvii TaxID=330214 RepID=A0ABM8S0J5_9BACT|nr:hypothetical protein NSPZN2_40780 [Nitrospira defluvii]
MSKGNARTRMEAAGRMNWIYTMHSRRRGPARGEALQWQAIICSRRQHSVRHDREAVLQTGEVSVARKSPPGG